MLTFIAFYLAEKGYDIWLAIDIENVIVITLHMNITGILGFIIKLYTTNQETDSNRLI